MTHIRTQLRILLIPSITLGLFCCGVACRSTTPMIRDVAFAVSSEYRTAPDLSPSTAHWEDSLTWSLHGVPAEGASVVIAHPVNLSSEAAIDQLRVVEGGLLLLGSPVNREALAMTSTVCRVEDGAVIGLFNNARLTSRTLVVDGEASVYLIARSSSISYEHLKLSEGAVLTVGSLGAEVRISGALVGEYSSGTFTRDLTTGKLQFVRD